jgi:hypothetical protein
MLFSSRLSKTDCTREIAENLHGGGPVIEARFIKAGSARSPRSWEILYSGWESNPPWGKGGGGAPDQMPTPFVENLSCSSSATSFPGILKGPPLRWQGPPLSEKYDFVTEMNTNPISKSPMGCGLTRSYLPIRFIFGRLTFFKI